MHVRGLIVLIKDLLDLRDVLEPPARMASMESTDRRETLAFVDPKALLEHLVLRVKPETAETTDSTARMASRDTKDMMVLRETKVLRERMETTDSMALMAPRDPLVVKDLLDKTDLMAL